MVFKWVKNNVVDPLTGRSAAKAGQEAAAASREASQLSADYQQQALDLFRERTKLPARFRDQALGQLMRQAQQGRRTQDFEGERDRYVGEILGAGQGAQAQLGQLGNEYMTGLQGLGRDYRASLMSGVDQAIQSGEEALLRRQAVTGGLRGGNAQRALSDRAIALQNQAQQQAAQADLGLGQAGLQAQLGLGQSGVQYATDAAMRGAGVGMQYDQMGRDYIRQHELDQANILRGIAGMNTGDLQQAPLMGNIGNTLAQGITGAAQANVIGRNQQAAQLMGLLNAGADAATAAMTGGAG